MLRYSRRKWSTKSFLNWNFTMDALSEASSNEKLSSLQKIKINGTRDTYLRHDVCDSTVFKCNSFSLFLLLCVWVCTCVCAQRLCFYGWSWGCSTGVVLACRNVCVACDVRACNAGQLWMKLLHINVHKRFWRQVFLTAFSSTRRVSVCVCVWYD